MKDFSDLEIVQIKSSVGKQYIRENHYSHSCHNGPMCWGLFDDGDLVGVCAFATPCSENVRSSLFGVADKHRVTELHRLHLQDYLPRNTASYFVSRAIAGLLEYRPDLRGIISFADTTEGHEGIIYRALNFLYCGQTGRATFYRDDEGRLRHPRQNGVNISVNEARSRGWTPETRYAKNRYILIIGPDRGERKYWTRRLQVKQHETPLRDRDLK